MHVLKDTSFTHLQQLAQSGQFRGVAEPSQSAAGFVPLPRGCVGDCGSRRHVLRNAGVQHKQRVAAQLAQVLQRLCENNTLLLTGTLAASGLCRSCAW